jgi:hypothetical protein
MVSSDGSTSNRYSTLDKTGIAEKTMNEVDHPSGKSLPPGEEEDDGVVLRAVRAFLLDDDVIGALDSDREKSSSGPFSGDSSTESSGSATEAQPVLPRKVPTATKYPPARPRMVNRSRVRLQNEIFSLRQKSIALERRLAELQREGSDTAFTTNDSTALTQTLSSPWQTAAMEQRERLEAADQKREKLRKKVSDYRQALKRVRQFVRRQIKKETTSAKLLPVGISRQTVLHPDAPIDFEDISEYLESMYTKLDSVFQDEDLNSVTRVTDELNKVRIQNEDSLNMSIEFVKSRVLPFDTATTAKAVWYYHTVKAGDPAVQAEGSSQVTEDVLRRTFVSTYTYPHFKGQTHGRSEVRRFVDKDRTIILECSIFHLIGGTGGIDGIEVLGGCILNWTVISPPRGERMRTASGRSASHVDSVQIATPFFASGSNTRLLSPKQRENIEKFFVASIECVHTYERQAIENILLSGTT